jgi:hypothetical protein
MFMHTTSHTTSYTTSYAMFIRLDLELGSGGSNCMHDHSGTGVCTAMYSFRHQQPHQRLQGQAAPERHRRLSRQRRQGQHPRRLQGLWKISPPRGGGAVSKRTYSPGQKEHVISAQHARAIAGAQARNAAHVELRHARALAGAHECMSMHACAHVARRRRGFEENVLAWIEGTRDQKSHGNFLHYSSVTSKLDTKCFLVRFPSLFK